MPNPNPKKPAHAWKKGQSGNPKGSSWRQKEGGEITKLTHQQIAEVGSLLLTRENGVQALKQLLAKEPPPGTTALKAWTAALILKSMQKGDSATFDRLLNRVVGRIPESFEFSGRDGGPIETTQTLVQMEAQIAAIRANKEEMGDD